MKILVFGPTDRYEVYKPDFADQLDIELVFSTPEQPLLNAAKANPDAEIIFADAIANVTSDIMDALPNLKMIHSEGVGYNCIDLDAARKRGVYVCNNKGFNADSVAEHTIMLMLMALRYGVESHNEVVAGRQIQMKQRAFAARRPGLCECSVGLMGFGDIAQSTARLLNAFGCKLYYYNVHRRSREVEAEFNVTYLPLEELVRTCDIISLHCAVTPDTIGMFNKKLITSMKPDAILVNTARGLLVDNDALLEAIVEGRIYAALDVIEPEPTPGDHPLVALPEHAKNRVIYSAHLAGCSGGSFIKGHRTMWENANRILNGEKPIHIVNF